MALPIGKKSLVQIERRRDPLRRVVELASLLEWLLRLESPPGAEAVPGVPPLAAVFAAYGTRLHAEKEVLAAVQVREAVVHAVPGQAPPSASRIDAAAQTLRDAILRRLAPVGEGTNDPQASLRAHVNNDPLGDLAWAEESQGSQETELRLVPWRKRVSEALWRLDVVSGQRAPFSCEHGVDRDLRTRLQRHRHLLTDVRPGEISAAIGESVPPSEVDRAAQILKTAAECLEFSLHELLVFDAQWKIPPGVLPLPVIRLEPDLACRVRLLVTLVEHQLAWVPPPLTADEAQQLLAEESGSLLRELLRRKGHLTPDAEELRQALDVRNRLVRVVPSASPLRVSEIERAERVLWRAAYALRRQCHTEHADALSAAPLVPLRTLPSTRIRQIANPVARLAAWQSRLEALAAAWEARHPGCWALADDDGRLQVAQVFKRHPECDQKDYWAAFPRAWDMLTAILGQTRDAERAASRDEVLAAEKTVSAVTDHVEGELNWKDAPRPLGRDELPGPCSNSSRN